MKKPTSLDWLHRNLNLPAKRNRLRMPQSTRLVLEPLEERYLLSLGLDPTFGSGGIVLNPSLSNTFDWSLAEQPDGKVLEAGSQMGNLVMIRENTDGTLDANFGGGTGLVPLALRSENGIGALTVAAITVEADGKILVAGSREFAFTIDGPSLHPHPPGTMIPMFLVYIPSTEFFLARFNADGTPDSTFGSGGMVGTRIGASDFATSLVVQADGKAIVAGSSDQQSALVRYNADGTLDSSFGQDGIVTTSVHNVRVATDSVGRILVAGSVPNHPENPPDVRDTHLEVTRYNSDGTLDSTFGNLGIAEAPPLGLGSKATSIATGEGDSIVVGGVSWFSPMGSDFASLTRFTSDGTLDTAFGESGQVLTGISVFQSSVSVAVQTDGKILLTAEANSVGTQLDLVLARHDPDGTQDDILSTTLGRSSVLATGSIVQSDGDIVVVGSSYPFSSHAASNDLTVARFEDISTSSVSARHNDINGLPGQDVGFPVEFASTYNPTLATNLSALFVETTGPIPKLESPMQFPPDFGSSSVLNLLASLNTQIGEQSEPLATSLATAEQPSTGPTGFGNSPVVPLDLVDAPPDSLWDSMDWLQGLY